MGIKRTQGKAKQATQDAYGMCVCGGPIARARLDNTRTVYVCERCGAVVPEETVKRYAVADARDRREGRA